MHVYLQEQTVMQMAMRVDEALGTYLSLTTQQMKLTAANLANVDTPGYRTQGFDFEGAFAQAMQHKTAPVAGDVDGLVARPDGNNVSLDRESMQLAKEQLQFRMGVALMKRDGTQMMSAIHADAK